MPAEPAYDPKYVAGSEYRSGGRAVRPRDAATLIIVRSDGGQPRILMGQRAAGHKFMPNKFVFPAARWMSVITGCALRMICIPQ